MLVAGRAADGRLYVVDHAWYMDRTIDHRVFVSEGAALRRVIYEGYVGGSDTQWTFPVARHEPSFTLAVTNDAGMRRMGVLSGTVQEEPFAIGEVGEELTPVGEDTLAGRTVYNFVAPIAFEYAARSGDGVTVAVLGPDPPEDYDHYRLFMGTDDLVEREVTSFVREKDGGTTTIEFIAEAADAVAYFPTPYSPELSPTLTLDGVTVDMTTLEPAALGDAV